MARRGRDEIGKAGFWSDTSASLDTSLLKTTLPSEDVKRGEPSNPAISPPGAGVFDNDEPVRPPIAPTPSSVTSDEFGGVDDEDDAAHEFGEALLLCVEDGSDVPMVDLRALFAAAVQRAAAAKERRDKLEDRCNGVAAENQALASELAKRRAEAGRAQGSKISMEAKCREKAQLHQLAMEQAKIATAAEEERKAELRDKFDTAIPSIQGKLNVEAERLHKQREDNAALRSKLVDFAEQTKLNVENQAARLQPDSLRIEILKTMCEREDAELRARKARSEALSVELERVKALHAKMKSEALERERCLTKIQSVLNERKKTAAVLETKIEQLTTTKASLEEKLPTWNEAATTKETVKGLEKMVVRLQSVCDQLEPDVEAKRSELRELHKARAEAVP